MKMRAELSFLSKVLKISNLMTFYLLSHVILLFKPFKGVCSFYHFVPFYVASQIDETSHMLPCDYFFFNKIRNL